jgi:hypothetical protein
LDHSLPHLFAILLERKTRPQEAAATDVWDSYSTKFRGGRNSHMSQRDITMRSISSKDSKNGLGAFWTPPSGNPSPSSRRAGLHRL